MQEDVSEILPEGEGHKKLIVSDRFDADHRNEAWPLFRELEPKGKIVPTFRPRFDYTGLMPGYEGYNPADAWDNILAQTHLAHSHKHNRESIENELEEAARVFLLGLENHRAKNPFFYYSIPHVKEAFILAYTIHHGQKRESNDAYIVHPKAVVYKMLDIIEYGKFDQSPYDVTTLIVEALLHDVQEDAKVHQLSEPNPSSPTTEEYGQMVKEYIQRCFSEDIAQVVDTLTAFSKRNKGGFSEIEQSIHQAVGATLWMEQPKMSKDIRDRVNLVKFIEKLLEQYPHSLNSIIIKLADRLHNLGTLQHKDLSSQKRISQITKDIFVPLAILIGRNEIAKKMEHQCWEKLLEKKEIGAYASVYNKVIAKMKTQYMAELQRLSQRLPSHNVQLRQDKLGRLISAFLTSRASLPHLTFEQFLWGYKTPIKLAIVCSDTTEPSIEMYGICNNICEQLLADGTIVKRNILTSYCNFPAIIPGNSVPMTNEKIEVVYNVGNIPITLKIVTETMDRLNFHGNMPPLKKNIQHFLQGIMTTIRGKQNNEITEHDIKGVIGALSQFVELSLGTVLFCVNGQGEIQVQQDPFNVVKNP